MSYKITYSADRPGVQDIEKEYSDIPFRIESQLFSLSGYEISDWANSSIADSFKPGQIISDAATAAELDGKTLHAQWNIHNVGQIKIKNGDEIVDISDIYSGIYTVFGKNQPFSYITFSLIKNLFNDESTDGYWANRTSVEGVTKPSLIQKETHILVDVYGIKGDWLCERVDDDDDTVWKVTAVSPAYALKTTTVESLLNFTYTREPYTATFTRMGIVCNLTPATMTDRYIADIEVNYIDSEYDEISDHVFVTLDLSQDIGSVEKISGSGSAIVALFLKYCAQYTGNTLSSSNRIFIDPGYIYDFTCGSTYDSVCDTYTQGEIRDAKNTKLPLYDETLGYNARDIEMRPDEYCWSIIQSIGYLTNRCAFFEKDAYFVDYLTVHEGEDSSIIQKDFTDLLGESTEKIRINWAGDNKIHDEYLTPEVIGLSTNEDQGSQYVLQSQKVISESYEATIMISDSISSVSGADIKYMYREKAKGTSTGDFEFNTGDRNFQTRIIGFNQLVNWYKPGDCIEYNLQEAQKEYTYVVKTLEELLSGEYPAAEGYTALVQNPALFEDYMFEAKFNGTQWVWPSTMEEGSIVGEMPLIRVEKYKPYCIASVMSDEQNGFVINNVPLARTIISYPSCVTTYTWGNPYFMDEESQISGIESITSDSTLDNTSSTQISDNYAAKIVVGNQSLAELDDDRTDFTGLILEKNWDVDLFRLAGYKEGVVQAQFNTEGKITAGGGVIVLDDSGMKTYSDSEDSKKDYKWVTHINTNGSFLTGNKINEDAGTNKAYIELNGSGLNVYYDQDTTYGSVSSQTNAINFKNITNPDAPFITTQFYNSYSEATEGNPARIEAHIDTNIDADGNPTALIFKCQGGAYDNSKYPLRHFKTDMQFSCSVSDIKSITGMEDLLNKNNGVAEIIHSTVLSSKSSKTYTYTFKPADGGIIDLTALRRQGATMKFNLYINSASSGSWFSGIDSQIKIYTTDGSVITSSETSSKTGVTFTIDISGSPGIRYIEVDSTLYANSLSTPNLETIFEDMYISIRVANTNAIFKMIPYDSHAIQMPSSTKIGDFDQHTEHLIYGNTYFFTNSTSAETLAIMGTTVRFRGVRNISLYDDDTRNAFIDRWVNLGFVRNTSNDILQNIDPDELVDKVISSSVALQKLKDALNNP